MNDGWKTFLSKDNDWKIFLSGKDNKWYWHTDSDLHFTVTRPIFENTIYGDWQIDADRLIVL